MTRPDSHRREYHGPARRDAGIEGLLHGPGKSAHRDIERETVCEAGVSFVAVLVFIAAVVFVGMRFKTNGTSDPTGGLGILGAIVLFVILMTGVGFYFAYQE